MEKKYREREILSKIVRKLRKSGFKVGLINGVFDLLHSGHIQIMMESKKFCDILIVALNSDSSTKKIKGKSRPILNQDERIKIISAIEYVDYVTIFDERTASKTLKIIKPTFHIKGGEYKNIQLPEKNLTQRHGIKTILIGDKKLNSTTDIIQKIKEL
ncbi:MAG: adenylyltransferase/cytidyltransferase family protein [Deltaproteobacteria bacterium]|nr:adenylyltransferase/cytidyltransferase family protein [Deltaproteobacteria bacterium]